jgi:putative transposase
LQYIIARAIERCKIFESKADYEDFLKRLGLIVKETQTGCLAWALIPNHFHLLPKTANTPISTVIRRLLTGYAVSFNRCHRRHGHLFQNSFKSILSQEDAYLLELVRYIHLNPLRAKLVSDINALNKYANNGHSVILGKYSNNSQDTRAVLRLFSNTVSQARRSYREFVQKGIEQSKRHDLIGGGLVRSSGGWVAVKVMRKAKLFQMADERILGDGDFVKSVLSVAQGRLEHKYALAAAGVCLDHVAKKAAELVKYVFIDSGDFIYTFFPIGSGFFFFNVDCIWPTSNIKEEKQGGIKWLDRTNQVSMSGLAVYIASRPSSMTSSTESWSTRA